MLSKLIAAVLVFKLLTRFGLLPKWRELKPRVDRAVNITLVVLVLAYAVQLVLWYLHHRAGSG